MFLSFFWRPFTALARAISDIRFLRTKLPQLPPAIVIGFVGGFIAHDNPVHSEVQLAARLRKEYPTGVDVETFESYRGDESPKRKF